VVTPKKRSSYGKAAEAMIAARIDLVDAVGRAYEQLERVEREATERIASARQFYAAAYAAAENGGWSRQQLENLKLRAPDGARPLRPRGRKRPAVGADAPPTQSAGVPGVDDVVPGVDG